MNEVGQLVVTMIVIQLIIFAVFVMVTRWVFRINRMVRLLESIDESLRQLPAVRSYDNSGQRIASV
jgi:hypothetical protein